MKVSYRWMCVKSRRPGLLPLSLSSDFYQERSSINGPHNSRSVLLVFDIRRSIITTRFYFRKFNNSIWNCCEELLRNNRGLKFDTNLFSKVSIIIRNFEFAIMIELLSYISPVISRKQLIVIKFISNELSIQFFSLFFFSSNCFSKTLLPYISLFAQNWTTYNLRG